MEVLFGYVPISEVPPVIESKTDVEKKYKVVKTQWPKRYLILLIIIASLLSYLGVIRLSISVFIIVISSLWYSDWLKASCGK
jgi:hypothetical protein